MLDGWLTEEPGEGEEAEVRRRQFLAEVAILGGMVLSDRVLRLSGVIDRVRPGRSMVDELDAVTRSLAAAWATTDPRRWLLQLRGHHAVLGVLADQASPLYVAELQQMAGRAAVLQGLAARFAGHQREAREAFTAAGIWAGVSGDEHLRALSLVWSSDIESAVQRGRPGPSSRAVRHLADSAEHHLGADAPPALAAQVLLRQAEEHAAGGEADEALRYLERADTAWATGRGHEEGLFGMPWGAPVNRAFAGNVLLLAGRAQEAVPILEGVLDEYPAGAASNRAAALTDLGAAMVRSGELEHGCELLGTAWREAVGAGLADRIGRVAGVRERDLAAFAGTPAVRQLDERMGVR